MKPQHRSVFISDIHLGTPECRVNYLLSFLRQLQCEQLYLVGDVIDFEAMEKRHYWPAEHTQVVLEVLALARRGVKVTYIPGNHDCNLRNLAGQSIAGVEIKLWCEHVAADGRRYRVSHGDEFDPEAIGKRWLLWVGEHAQRWLSVANRAFNRLRRGLSLPYLPLSIIAKSRVSAALHYIRQYQQRVALHARDEGYDGHICGHIHFGHVQSYDGVLYLNRAHRRPGRPDEFAALERSLRADRHRRTGTGRSLAPQSATATITGAAPFAGANRRSLKRDRGIGSTAPAAKVSTADDAGAR